MVARQRPDRLFDVAEEPAEVIVKQTLPSGGRTVLEPSEITAHLAEGLLHVLAWRAVQRSAAPWAVPRPYELFGDHSPALPGWRSMSLCMSWVRGRTLQMYAEKHWRPGGEPAVGVAFLEILAQVAYVLWVLQTRLRMNHRDVKVNNLMIRTRRGGAPPAVLELGGARMSTGLAVTLIDFGFACVGCPPPRRPMSAFQTGSFFPTGDICCKAGRDLAQLIFCIHCFFPLDRYLPRSLYEVVRRWMTVVTRSHGRICMLDGFTEGGVPLVATSGPVDYNKGIYEFLRRDDVEPVACEPVSLFRECCRLKALLTLSG
jgi:serine/threonine protein kinase